MAIQFLNQPTGSQYFPTVGAEESQLPLIMERIALNAEKRRARAEDTKILKQLGITVPGFEARPEPTSMIGKVMRGLGDVFRPAPAPMSDIGRAVIEGEIGKKYPSATDLLTTTLLTQALGREGVGKVPEAPEEAPPEYHRWELKKTTTKGIPTTGYVPTPMSYKERFDFDVGRVISKEKTWPELKSLYPREDIETVRKQHTPIVRSPAFKEVRKGSPLAVSKTKAHIRPSLKVMVNQIKTEADYDEFMKDALQRGYTLNDLKVVREIFGRR